MKSKLKTMLGKEMIAIDIGSQSTQLVEGVKFKKGIVVKKAVSFETPKDTYENGHIIDFNKVSNYLDSKLTEHKFKSNLPTVCTLESSNIITREISLPYTKPKDLRRSIEYEVGQYLPVEVNKYVVQYKLIEVFFERDVKKARILIAALPRDIAEDYFNLVNSLHLKPQALDIHSNAINQLFDPKFEINDGIHIQDKTLALLDIGYNQLNVIIVKNGIFKFSRLLNIGIKDIDTNIMDALGINMEEATKRRNLIRDLRDNADATEYGKTIKAAQDAVDSWNEAIQRIFRYYTSRSSENNINMIYIYGGAVHITGLNGYLKAFFNLPTYKIEKVNSVEFKNDPGNISPFLNSIGAIMGR
ncbi:pilus assembly protein PilM [Serpentinicella sp. ANB-PHB4]|uniref:pilus assembly protein PilM n=1 Tax=Serpentinicella sp. ANB-PHB4 TaxID=3074076 RepID=UPI00285752C1|nr:pilus assembly protein PilM [Serpentinicella sp. ANB-PHB4]MDR5658126.1 pilus assembly protein PilM [Serpentinicella sp. ANB-PHB4]